jgi:hypothetical protein
LLNALGIPGKVIVHHQRAELEVDTPQPLLRSNHDLSLLSKIIDSGPHVRCSRTCYPVGPSMVLQPGVIDLTRPLVVVRSIKQDDSVSPRTVTQYPEKVALCSQGFRKDDGFFAAPSSAALINAISNAVSRLCP